MEKVINQKFRTSISIAEGDYDIELTLKSFNTKKEAECYGENINKAILCIIDGRVLISVTDGDGNVNHYEDKHVVIRKIKEDVRLKMQPLNPDIKEDMSIILDSINNTNSPYNLSIEDDFVKSDKVLKDICNEFGNPYSLQIIGYGADEII